jgi:ribosomal protein L17
MNLATISTRRALGVNRQVRVGLKAESLAGPRQKGRRRYKDSKRSRDRLERWTWVNKMYSWAGRLCFGIASFEGRQSHPYSLLLQRLTRIVHAEGIHATLKKLKEERVHFYRLLSECGDEGGRSQALVQLRKRFGVPLVEVVQKSLNADKTALDELRMFQTVLTSLAFLRASGDLDVSPVTDPFLGLG